MSTSEDSLSCLTKDDPAPVAKGSSGSSKIENSVNNHVSDGEENENSNDDSETEEKDVLCNGNVAKNEKDLDDTKDSDAVNGDDEKVIPDDEEEEEEEEDDDDEDEKEDEESEGEKSDGTEPLKDSLENSSERKSPVSETDKKDEKDENSKSEPDKNDSDSKIDSDSRESKDEERDGSEEEVSQSSEKEKGDKSESTAKNEKEKSECNKEASQNGDVSEDSKDIEEIEEIENDVLGVDRGFPEVLKEIVNLGKYMPIRNLDKNFKLKKGESLIECPSLVIPFVMKRPNKILSENAEKKEKPEPPINSQKDFFSNSVGKLLFGLGLSRAKEWHERDMIKLKERQVKKEGKGAVTEEELTIHRKALGQAKQANDPFTFKQKKCEFCDFRTESATVMDGHYLIPHFTSRREFRCNFCTFITRDSKAILFHMEALHGKLGMLNTPLLFYECPYCSFDTNLKTKATSHINKCQRQYMAIRNHLLSDDSPLPTMTARPVTLTDINNYEKYLSTLALNRNDPTKMLKPLQAQLQRPRQIRPSFTTSTNLTIGQLLNSTSQITPRSFEDAFIAGNVATNFRLPPGLIISRTGSAVKQNVTGTQSLLHTVNTPGTLSRSVPQPVALFSSVTSSGTSAAAANANRAAQNKVQASPKPGVSVTPVPKLEGPYAVHGKVNTNAAGIPVMNSFVICEICDGYIKDLELLRTHMQLIHKVKIHPKMLTSRPPLNCQKCQWRFFTDQGLERHLLGAHGLVTSNMQELANTNQDGGRCTVCGRVFACKLVAHMSQFHHVTLKPAHLSYKCTVCTATFTLYRLFESHVYLVHSGSVKRQNDDSTDDKPNKKAATDKENVSKKNESKVRSIAPKIVPMSIREVCKECGESFPDIYAHIKEKHMKKYDVKLCRIEKCDKCLSSFDGMVIFQTSDLGIEEEEMEVDEEGSDEEVMEVVPVEKNGVQEAEEEVKEVTPVKDSKEKEETAEASPVVENNKAKAESEDEIEEEKLELINLDIDQVD